MNFIDSETAGLILFFIGIYGLTARRNIIKTIISISIMSGGAIFFFLSISPFASNNPPVGDVDLGASADPAPQALMITAIVIGISITAVALAMFIRMYHKYGTTNWKKALVQRMERDKK